MTPRPPRTRGPAAARAIVVLLSAALAGAGLVSSGLIFTRAYLGMSNRSLVVAQVSPGGPAAAAGVRPGDRIVTVGGIPAATRGSECRLALRGVRAGESLTVELEGPEGGRRAVAIRGAPPPAGEIAWRSTAAAAGLCALLLGLLIVYQRPEKLTLVFFGICFAIAFFLREQPIIHTSGWRTVHETLYNLFELLLPALFVHFFLLFPAQPRSARRRLLERLLYLPAALIIVFALIQAMRAAAPGGDSLRREAMHLALTTLYFVIYAALAVVLFVRSFRRTRGARERAQLRAALVGTVLGLTPLVVATILANLFPAAELPGLRYSMFALLLVPASFAYAAFRHQVFDVEILVKRSVLYSVLSAILLAIYFGMVLGLGSLLHRLTGAQNPLLTLVSVVVIALIAAPARARLQRLTDRIFYRERYDARLTLRRFSHDLARMLELGGIATLLVERVVDILELESAVLLLRRAPGGPLVPIRASPPLEGEAPSVSEHVAYLFEGAPARDGAGTAAAAAADELAARAADSARSRPVRLDGPAGAARLELLLYEDRRAIRQYRPAVALPLWGRPELLAVLLLGARRAGAWTSSEDLDLLETLGEQASIAIENAILHRTALERERMAQELAVASRIQAHLLPEREPDCDTVEFSGSTLACHEIGGDFYDYVPLAPERLGMAIGDVSGKGIPAALLMAGLQSSFRLEAERGGAPAAVLRALNHRIHAVGERDRERFVCFFYGLLDLKNRQLTYSNAGLDPPILVRASGRVERLRLGGPVLGIFAEPEYAEGKVSLAAGDTLVLFTDGLVEPAEMRSGFGEAELIEFLVAHRDEPAPRLRELTLARLVDLAGEVSLDDTTLIVARAR